MAIADYDDYDKALLAMNMQVYSILRLLFQPDAFSPLFCQHCQLII